MIEDIKQISGLKVISPKIFNDERGFFFEVFNLHKYRELLGLDPQFTQDNRSFSYKGVLRGLHFQKKYPQGKLVNVVKGKIFDVAVDIRKNSKSFGKWFSIELSSENNKQFWIPPGFAHGFLVISESAIVEYKVTGEYLPEDEKCLIWNDEFLNINWPIKKPKLSEKDKKGQTFEDIFLN